MTGKTKFFKKIFNPCGILSTPAVSALPAIAMTGDPVTAGNVPKIPPLNKLCMLKRYSIYFHSETTPLS